MKTRFIVMALIMVLAGCSATGGKPLLGLDANLLKAQADEMNALKSEVKGDMSAVKGDISAMKGNIGEITGVKGDVSALKGSIEKLTAQIAAQGAAQIGAGNTATQQTAGGNITSGSGNTNDTDLLKFIFDKWWMIFVALIGLMKWNSLRDDKKHEAEIKRIELEKKFYKDTLIARTVKDETDLSELRRKHDDYVAGKKIDKKES